MLQSLFRVSDLANGALPSTVGQPDMNRKPLATVAQQRPTLSVGQPIYATLSTESEVDSYRVQVEPNHRYLVEMTGQGGTPLPYAFLTVYNESTSFETLIRKTDTRTHAGETAAVGWQVIPGLDYVIEVSNENWTAVNGVRPIGGYQLIVKELPLDDHSDLRSLATPLAIGQRLNGNFDVPLDRDEFKVDLKAGINYTYTIRASGETPVAAPIASIFDEQGYRQSYASHTSLHGVFTGSFVPTASGTYFLEAAFNRFIDKGHLVGGGYTIEILGPGDTLPAPNLDDQQTGTAGDDSFLGGPGNDTVNGLGGIDTVYYASLRSSYSLTRLANAWQVTDKSSGDGIDTLTSIERIRFSGTDLALDIDGHAGQTAKILGALFGPSAVKDRVYMGIGIELLDRGMSYFDLVKLAIRTDAFLHLAGSTSNTDFVKLVYKNVVGTAPSASELKLYVDLLNDGTHTQASLAALACDTPANAAHIDLVGLATTGIVYTPFEG